MNYNLLELPLDVIIYIVKFNGINTFLQFMITSKYAHNLLNNNILWNYHLETTYNNAIEVLPKDKSEKEKYIICHELNKLLKYFDNKITISEIFSLQTMNLYGKQLQKIPKELSQLTNLQELYLGSNQIKEIPKELSQLTNLQRLYLDNNQIKEIPKELSQLTNLQYLYSYNNQIKEIPKELQHLVNNNILKY